MNINTHDYVERFGETLHSESTLDAEVREHHEILIMAGVELAVDRQYILIPEGIDFPGSMQVWSKTAHGVWVWIDILGVMHERTNPLIHEGVMWVDL